MGHINEAVPQTSKDYERSALEIVCGTYKQPSVGTDTQQLQLQLGAPVSIRRETLVYRILGPIIKNHQSTIQ